MAWTISCGLAETRLFGGGAVLLGFDLLPRAAIGSLSSRGGLADESRCARMRGRVGVLAVILYSV